MRRLRRLREFWCSQGGSMQTKFGFSVLFLTVALVVSVGRANPGTRSPEASEIERGRYLVEEVAKCGECHYCLFALVAAVAALGALGFCGKTSHGDALDCILGILLQL